MADADDKVWFSMPLYYTPGTALSKKQRTRLEEKHAIFANCNIVLVDGKKEYRCDPNKIKALALDAMDIIYMNRERERNGLGRPADDTDTTDDDEINDRKTPLTCVLVCRPRMGRLHTAPPHAWGRASPHALTAKVVAGGMAGHDVKLSFYPFGFDTTDL